MENKLKDNKGKSQLHKAIEQRFSMYIIQKLLDEGCDVNVKDDDGNTPLHYALKYKCSHLDEVKNYERQNSRYRTHRSYNLEVAQNLLNCGADLKARNNEGATPLHFAAEQDEISLQMIQELIKQGANDAKEDDICCTPLHYATCRADCTFEVIAELLDYGAKVNVQDHVGKTALHYAIELNGGNLKVIEELFKHAARVTETNHTWNTPLHHAVCRNGCSLELVRELLHRGAYVCVEDFQLRTPLHYAVLSNEKNLKVIQQFLKQNADFSASDRLLNSPLHPTMCDNFAPVVRELLSYGASFGTPYTSDYIPVPILKTFTKYVLLEPALSVKMSHIMNKKCPEYLASCKSEIDKMITVKITDELTLYDLLSVKGQPDYGKVFSCDHDVLADLPSLAKGYPIYNDIIMHRLETKSYLIKKLCDLSLSVEVCPNKIVNVNADCVQRIANHLEFKDVRSLIGAL